MVLWLFLIPMALGMLVTKQMKKEWQGFPMVFVTGYLILFASFQFVYLWFVVFYNRFEVLTVVYAILIVAAAIISLTLSGRYWIKEVRDAWAQKTMRISKGRLLLWSAVCLLVGLQLYNVIFYQFLDSDDAYYAAISVITNENLTMYKNIPYTGEPSGLDVRHAFSSAPVFISFVARLTGVHPTIITHSVYPVIVLLLFYMIMTILAGRLLKKQKEYIPLFLIFVSMFYLFGNASIYTDATFLLTRTSQGKAFLANVVPAALVMNLLHIWENENGRKRGGSHCIPFVMLSVTMITAVYASTMGVFLGPFIAGGGILIMMLSARKIRPFLPAVLSMIPLGIMGILILLLH